MSIWDSAPEEAQERQDIALRPLNSDDPPEILEETALVASKSPREQLPSREEWASSPSWQETTGSEIRARVIREIQRRQTAAQTGKKAAKTGDDPETVNTVQNTTLEELKIRFAHQETMFELQTRRLEAFPKVVDALARLAELGITVDFQLISGQIFASETDDSSHSV